MDKICDLEKCTACYSCVNTCPKKSVKMQEDALGYLYPVINQKTCIDCGLCQKSCPVLSPLKLKTPANVYAAINKSKDDYETATSGGIATLFSRKILEQNGVVYGAAVCDNIEIKHIRVEKQEDVDKIKGSKYVQSKIGDSFKSIKSDLETGRKVLFVGTPCQVAGLKKFLHRDFEELYTCDIVCHGVPAARLLKEHLNEVTDVNNIESISFRDRDGYYLSVCTDNKVVYRKKNFYDIFCLGFLRGLFCRQACFSCPYAQSERVGDITLGDFWGFDNKKEAFPVKTKDGLSLVMVNTQKGQKLFDNSNHNMIYLKRELEEAVNGNKQLRHPSKKHKNYNKFRDNYLKSGFEKAAKRALWKERIAYAMIDKIGK